jgi:hypothetical protein
VRNITPTKNNIATDLCILLYPALLATHDFGVLRILQEWWMFCDIDVLVVYVLDE